MKHITFAVTLVLLAAVSSTSFAKPQTHQKRKVVVISFSDEDARARKRGPASIEEQKEMAAQARHVVNTRSLDQQLSEL